MGNKILITGSGGFLGKNLYRVLGSTETVFGIDRLFSRASVNEAVDLSDAKQCYEALNKIHPSVIVHCAAYSNVDGAEANKEEVNKNNIAPVEILTKWADQNRAKFVFISTDYVYDGGKGNFTEIDPVNPLQYYGYTKVLGERMVSALKDYVILRPTVIYGFDKKGKNFFMQVMDNFMSGVHMVVPTDQISNPTSVIDLSFLIKRIIAKPEINGTFVATGPEAISRYDLALRICDFFSWNNNFIIPKTTAEIGRLAKRPLNNSTNSAKIRAAYDFNFRTLEENLKEIKQLICL
jgi:dTDP-4-dehydrorhamnose reductase